MFWEIVGIEDLKVWINLLKNNKIKLNCIVFNVCHSAEFAQIASTFATYAIGHNDAILEPKAAIEFSKGFYTELKTNYDIEQAFLKGLLYLHSERNNLLIRRQTKHQFQIPELYKDGNMISNSENLFK